MFVVIALKFWVSDIVRRMKGRSSDRVQRESAWVNGAIGGNDFGYCSTTSGKITDEVIFQYLEAQIETTDISR